MTELKNDKHKLIFGSIKPKTECTIAKNLRQIEFGYARCNKHFTKFHIII